MATGPGVNPGKTAFVEEFLASNRDANEETVNQAWTAAGNEGTISGSLVSKTRQRLGLSGKRGRSGGMPQEDSGPGKSKSSPKATKEKRDSQEQAPSSRPIGREGDTGPSKSAFVQEMLGRNPKANVKAINGAWAAAGNEGSISDSVIYKVKRERGGANPTAAAPQKPRAKSAKGPKAKPATQPTMEVHAVSNGASAPSKATGGSRSGGRERVLDRVEDRIDDLIIELKQLGGMEEALEALRKVRRVVVRSYEG